MLRYSLIRIFWAVPILAAVSFVNSTLICLAPTGQADMCGPNMPAEICETWRQINGQDKSCAEQYGAWAYRMFVVEPAYQFGLFDAATKQG